MPSLMANIRKAWRWTAVVSAAAVAVALATSAFAQAPPSPPHQFFGSADTGSGAILDGAAAPDGATVNAVNEAGEAVGSGTIANGTWLIQVDPAAATSVTFNINGGSASASFPVTSGDLTEVALDLTSTGAPAPPPAPGALPNTGSGGLAGDDSGLPVLPIALAAAAIVALGGVALARRTVR